MSSPIATSSFIRAASCASQSGGYTKRRHGEHFSSTPGSPSKITVGHAPSIRAVLTKQLKAVVWNWTQQHLRSGPMAVVEKQSLANPSLSTKLATHTRRFATQLLSAYCEHGCEIWTSVYLDIQAPHRLARARERSLHSAFAGCPRNSYRCGTVELRTNPEQPAPGSLNLVGW